MRVVVREVANELGDPFEEGQKVHDLVSPILARGEEVDLDFQGMRFFSALFLNSAVGQLLRDHPLQRVNALLHFHNLDALHVARLESVKEKSSRYFTEPRYREAADRVLARMFEDQ